MNADRKKDYYEVLGIAKEASPEDIKKAYRKLSLQFHPDRNNNSPESTTKFQSISAAYEVIGDEDKRRQYDMQSKMQIDTLTLKWYNKLTTNRGKI